MSRIFDLGGGVQFLNLRIRTPCAHSSDATAGWTIVAGRRVGVYSVNR